MAVIPLIFVLVYQIQMLILALTGGVQMDSPMEYVISLAPPFVTLVGVIVSVLLATRNGNHKIDLAQKDLSKENSDLSHEHEGLSHEHEGLSHEHEGLSHEHADILGVLGKGETSIIGLLNPVREYVQSEKALREVKKEQINSGQITVTQTMQNLNAFMDLYVQQANEITQLKNKLQELQREKSELQALYEKASRKHPRPIITPPTGRSR